MARFLGSARFATMLALCLGLFVTGLVSGATGGNFILGVLNSATSQTALQSATSANAVFVENTSSGNGAIYVSNAATGIAGVTRAGSRYALAGTNDGSNAGGGAINAQGKLNHGLVANSMHSEANAVQGINTGVVDSGDGFANGVFGESRFFLGNGVYANATAAGEEDEGWGVWGNTSSPLGFGVVGSNLGGGAAGLFSGDVLVEGDIYAGTCFCVVDGGPALAQGAIGQGQAVTLVGATTAPDGRTIMTVRAAAPGEQVVGVADRTLRYVPSARRDGSFTLRPGAAGAADGAHVLVVTGGTYAFGAAAGAITASQPLAVGAGGLVAAAPIEVNGTTFYAPGTTVGYSLGAAQDGRVVIFVSPH